MHAQSPIYSPRRESTIERVRLRNGDVLYQLRRWTATPDNALDTPPLLLTHGWMDIGASFQRCVDELHKGREVIALDWRGFGGSRVARAVDSYWFYDYYADLDALIDYLSPNAPIDLLGHSMGGNIVMTYAGACPTRIRRLINVEGFGLTHSPPSEASSRLALWLSELKTPVSIRTFANRQEVIDHLTIRSPRIDGDFAGWLASHWAECKENGRWHVSADAAHKRVNPILYRSDEVLSTWAQIEAPVLWVEGNKSEISHRDRAGHLRHEFEDRLNKVESLERIVIDECGHMVHLDQPSLLASAIEKFLNN